MADEIRAKIGTKLSEEEKKSLDLKNVADLTGAPEQPVVEGQMWYRAVQGMPVLRLCRLRHRKHRCLPVVPLSLLRRHLPGLAIGRAGLPAAPAGSEILPLHRRKAGAHGGGGSRLFAGKARGGPS